MSKPFSASYSAIKLYEGCPAAYKYKRIDKLPDGDGTSPPLVRGNAVHKLQEYFLKDIIAGDTPPVPVDLQRLAPIYAAIQDRIKEGATLSAEGELAYRRDWTVCGWFDADCYFRVKIDAYLEHGHYAVVQDLKTGRPRIDEYEAQLGMYALAVFKRSPNVEVVISELHFVDHPLTVSPAFRYERSKDAARLEQIWTTRAKAVEVGVAAGRFGPKPGDACTFCAYKASSGRGLCRY